MSVALYLSRRLAGVQALPFPQADVHTTTTCDDINNCRTTTDIVWSCLTTVFTCTWVAIHPNIPAPYESSFEIGLRRFGIVLMALMAPELVIMWAMRQWLVSLRLAQEHQSKGWTQTHGFFALMGGFMLVDGDGKEIYTLLPTKLKELSKEGKIMFPKITKKEIEDRSKGDAISKGFVLVQTGWFVLQCIARGVEHLPITELEIVTLAFAVLNLVTYALWWNKPQNVECSFPVHLSDPDSPQSNDNGEVGEVPAPYERARRAICDKWDRPSILLPVAAFFQILGVSDGKITHAKTVPPFYAGENMSERGIASLSSVAIAAVFGALHCIAWSFHFPSQEKEILWRACSVAITCLPVSLVFLGQSFGRLSDFSERCHGVAGIVAHILAPGFLILTFLILPIIYIVSREILIVEAFILLKSLPPGALRTVQWTNFIPHV